MFFPEALVQVYLYEHPTDMRKSFDGLYALARKHFEVNPLTGHLFVFTNRRRTMLKALYFDRSGWCIWSKRLEAGHFKPPLSSAQNGRIDYTDLKLMLEGIEVKRTRKRYHLSNISD